MRLVALLHRAGPRYDPARASAAIERAVSQPRQRDAAQTAPLSGLRGGCSDTNPLNTAPHWGRRFPGTRSRASFALATVTVCVEGCGGLEAHLCVRHVGDAQLRVARDLPLEVLVNTWGPTPGTL